MRALVFFTIAAIDLLVPLQIVAQQYSMQHYSVNEGLIQSDVNKIIEDHKKYIWIATNGGVSRFDGLKLINYKIPISQIAYDIVEGDRDERYVLMNDGIGLLRNDSICSFPFAEGTRLGKCRNLVFNSGKLWMITNQGLSSFDRRGFHLQLSFEGFGLNPVRFFINSNNVFWIINSDATVWLIENNKLTRFESDGRPIGIGQEIMFSKMGMVYGIHEKKRVFVDHFDHKELNHLQRVGDFWYYSSNSQVFRKKGDITELVFEAPENDLIRSLLIDNEKRIWIGTHNGFYFSNSLLFRRYLIPGKLDNEVYGIVQDNNQNLWFTSFGKGLTKSNGNSFEHLESYKNILNTDTFNTGSIKKADGNLLFPTTKGILLFNGNRFSKVAEIPSQTYEYIYEDIKNNTMFYAGEKSLVIVKGSNVKIFDNVKYHLPQIFDIIKDRNNIYRLGGEEKTVFYDGRNFLSPDISRFGYTKGLYSSVQDINGNLWFATRYGLMIYDYKTCKPVLTEDIREAVFDLKIFFGKIYFGTIKGVGLIDPERFYKKEHSVTYFDYKNGYQGEEVVRNGAIIALDSSIWIPATRGVTRFFPSGIKTISHLLPVQVETIVVSDLSGNTNVLTSYDLDKNDKITLKNKYCNIEINYHCSYYSDPDGLSYKYKLENYDQDWHNVPFNVRNIKYSQLPPGQYIFKINAFNRQGAISVVPTVIYIEIARVIWQKEWFILMLSLFAILIAFAIFRNLKKREQAKSQIQQQILKLKSDALSAQMNPHFVFNCISSINALINLGDKQEATRYLGRFATLLRSVLKSISVNEITLEEELQMTENYMQLEQGRYSKPFNYTIERADNLNSTLILIPPLILHPYIENSILHGFIGPGNIDKRINILAVISGDNLMVVIEDNGFGITSEKSTEAGSGMRITKERITFLKNNAHVQIESRIDEIFHGTTVTISIPLKIKKMQND